MKYFEMFELTSVGTTVVFATVATNSDRSWQNYNPSTIGMGFWADSEGKWRLGTSSASRGKVSVGRNATGTYRFDYEITLSVQSGTASTYRAALFTGTSYIRGSWRTFHFETTAKKKTISGGGIGTLKNPSNEVSLQLYSEATVASTMNVWESRVSAFQVETSGLSTYTLYL